MINIPTELYYHLFEQLSFNDIKKLCNTNKQFKSFCLNNQNFIDSIKLRALKKLLKQSKDFILDFAVENGFCFDEKSLMLVIESKGMCTRENKFTIDLLYLINKKLYDEAYTLIKLTQKVPEPESLSIFSKFFNTVPKKIVELYMSKLPPILDLFGYDNVEDFYEDNHLENIKNKSLIDYIKRNLK